MRGVEARSNWPFQGAAMFRRLPAEVNVLPDNGAMAARKIRHSYQVQENSPLIQDSLLSLCKRRFNDMRDQKGIMLLCRVGVHTVTDAACQS